MKTKKPKGPTEAQQRILDSLSTTEFQFVPGKEKSCWALKSLGLVESKLMLARRDNVKGLTQLKTAFRRIK